jgi:hypothetical protein
MDLIREPGPYFHLSLDGDKIEDLFEYQLGFYKIPTMAYYGINFPYGGNGYLDLLGVVKSSGFQLNIPQDIMDVVQSCEGEYYTYPPPNYKGNWQTKSIRVPIPQEIEFFWVVSDISELVVTVFAN